MTVKFFPLNDDYFFDKNGRYSITKKNFPILQEYYDNFIKEIDENEDKIINDQQKIDNIIYSIGLAISYLESKSKRLSENLEEEHNNVYKILGNLTSKLDNFEEIKIALKNKKTLTANPPALIKGQQRMDTEPNDIVLEKEIRAYFEKIRTFPKEHRSLSAIRIFLEEEADLFERTRVSDFDSERRSYYEDTLLGIRKKLKEEKLKLEQYEKPRSSAQAIKEAREAADRANKEQEKTDEENIIVLHNNKEETQSKEPTKESSAEHSTSSDNQSNITKEQNMDTQAAQETNTAPATDNNEQQTNINETSSHEDNSATNEEPESSGNDEQQETSHETNQEEEIVSSRAEDHSIENEPKDIIPYDKEQSHKDYKEALDAIDKQQHEEIKNEIIKITKLPFDEVMPYIKEQLYDKLENIILLTKTRIHEEEIKRTVRDKELIKQSQDRAIKQLTKDFSFLLDKLKDDKDFIQERIKK